MTLGDRVAVMNDGEIQQVARPQELYDYPANRFVAEFIGSPAMNGIPVRLVVEGDDVVATNDDVRIVLPTTDDLVELGEREAILGVRPEDMQQDADTADNRIEADVEVTEPLGDRMLLHGLVDGELIKFQISARSALESGDTVSFGTDLDRLHLFDPETGETLYHSDQQISRRATATAEQT
jgi:multiple sugar transport system ATP-binding protein